jgi:hypothetical protein
MEVHQKTQLHFEKKKLYLNQKDQLFEQQILNIENHLQ